MATTKMRVKVYCLNNSSQWEDKGTGQVSTTVNEESELNVIVCAESDNNTIILDSIIRKEIDYQRQQGTLVVWCEDGKDLALSFQEIDGCNDIWQQICDIRGIDPSEDSTVDSDVTLESEEEQSEEILDTTQTNYPKLPPCNLSKLEEISEVITNCLSSHNSKTQIATEIINEDYIDKLIELFQTCEDLDNIDGLHQLYDIFNALFLINKIEVVEIMLRTNFIFVVVGILEYDPSTPTTKNHREFLRNASRYIEIIPNTNAELISKIHQTYRAEYILDIALPTPSIFEENTYSSLKTFILNNKVDIVEAILNNDTFLKDLLVLVRDDSTPEPKVKEIILFLKEFCNFSQISSLLNKDRAFKTLINLGLFQVLESTLKTNHPIIKIESCNILSQLVTYSPSLVRKYVIAEANECLEDNQMLLNIIIEQMVGEWDPDLNGAAQLSWILRYLLDPDTMTTEPEEKEFLKCFYHNSMDGLVAPINSNKTKNKLQGPEGLQTAQLLGHILELLIFFIEHHISDMKNYIVRKDVLRKILELMESKHQFLGLSALRFMRKIIGLKDEFYNRYIIFGNLFGKVINLFLKNNGVNNLIESAILEMFEFIRIEKIKSLCVHVMERHGEVLVEIDYVTTFQSLLAQYEHYRRTDIPPDRPTTVSPRKQIQPRLLPMLFESSKEEENQELEAKENTQTIQISSEVTISPISPNSTSVLSSNTVQIHDVSTTVPRRINLVDYPDEDSDEEEEEDENDCFPSDAKRFKVSN